MNDLPIKVVNGATIYIRDVGAGARWLCRADQYRAHNGTRGALLTVMRNGAASTLDIVNQVKAALPKILAGLPPELKVRELFDQSVFVRAAIKGVLREAIIAAFLTGHDDPAVPGKLALHDHRLHLDSALHSASLAILSLLGRDHQRHDAGRPRARRRHSGG